LDKAAAWLKQSLAYTFDDDALLRRALTHRSSPGPNNERLEFLGDAVLQLVISELVFEKTKDASEGQLSRLRSTLVKDTTLAEVAEALILADALEAIFGAVYIDAGLEGARQIIHRAYGARLHELPEAADLRDPKSRLQELLQGRNLALPDYKIEKTSGKAHKQTFDVICSIPELDAVTSGTGASRRDAEQEAALAMLEKIEGND
jgi:ribonuclease-3